LKPSFAAKIRQGFTQNFSSASESLLESSPSHKFRSLVVIWLAGLYVLGIIGFGLFFQWGDYDLLYHDWAQITGPRLAFLRSAILEKQFPLNISDTETLHFVTDRYLSVPDAVISPQYLLLYKLPFPVFSLVNVWLLYSAGFAGLLVLKRKLRMSLISFSALFLLFNFNGNILAHYSVGHTTWGGYFLFPWFIWLVFRLMEGDHSWLWTTLMAVLMFIMWLQGSFHQFVWMLILLAGVAVFVPKHFWIIIKTGLITFVVCAFRFLPAILSYQGYKQSFINGYPTLFSIWAYLVNLPNAVAGPYFVNNSLGTALGEWELTSYIGLIGGLFLVYFGFYRGLIHRQSPYRGLLGPLGIILLLSNGAVFNGVLALPIPLIQGERVSSRMFSLVLAFGLVLAAERFQRWLDGSSQKPFTVAGGLLGLAVIGVDLWQDFGIWQISNRVQDFWIYFNPGKWFVKNSPSDTIYIWFVFGGLAISVLAILVLGWLSWREHPAAHPKIKKVLVILLLSLIGWGILLAVIVIGSKVTTISNTLIIQLIAAPILYAVISRIYFKRFGYTTPLQTALILMGVVILMHAVALAFFTQHGVNTYLKPVSTWLAFGLIFGVTYLEGRILKKGPTAGEH
jgi:hypothetical protein